MGFTVISPDRQDRTCIPDAFIRIFMPSANGNYVKIYLYLQMLCQHPDKFPDITVNDLADEMDCTENDILRALRYWKKQKLLDWMEQDGELSEISLLPLPSAEAGTDVESTGSKTDSSRHSMDLAASETDKDFSLPEKQNYTPLQAEALRHDIEIDRAISRVEEILAEPVSPTHLQLILYFMCDVGFSADLLIALYETAVHKGKKKTSYIEAIGISWAKKGIQTAEEAKEEASAFHGRYSLVSRTLGIRESLAPVHREIIDSWNHFHFSDDIIEEACTRAALQTGGGAKSLRYVSRILKQWNDAGVHNTDDIKKNDENFRNRRRNTSKSTAKSNAFQNFPQREYSQAEYSSLEQRLLQKQ